MLSFLNSVVLPALLAAAIPLIIHFFNRKKTKKVSFSSLRFLKLLENKRIKQLRLYQVLLIIIRVLFIVFLVLAFARPTLKNHFLFSDPGARTTAVFLLDDSYSMQSYYKSQTFFEMALSDLKKIKETFHSNDQLFVVSPSRANDDPVILNPASSSSADNFRVSNNSPAFDKALAKIRQVFDSHPNYNKELFILSDFRVSKKTIKNSVSSFFEDINLSVYLVGPPHDAVFSNVSIDTVIIKNRLFEPKKPVQLSVRLKNDSRENKHETSLNLYNDSNRLAMADVVVPVSGFSEVDLNFVPQKAGFQLLQIELNEDDLLIDNYFYTNIYLAESVKILYVENKRLPAIKTALDLLSSQTLLDIEISDYQRWNGKNLEYYDLILLNDPPVISGSSSDRLSSYLSSGKNIYLIPGQSLSPALFNNQFRALTGKNLILDFVNSGSAQHFFSITENTKDNPLFRPIFTSRGIDPDMPKIFKYFRLNKSGASLIRLSDGQPFLSRFDGAQKQGSVYVLASQFQDTWTDFQLKGFFIPMLYRLLYSGGQREYMQENHVIDEPVSFKLSSLDFQKKYIVIPPGQSSYEIIPEQTATGLYFNLGRLPIPGHYKLFHDKKHIRTFSLNTSTRETQGPFINFAKINNEVVRLESGSDYKDQILAARSGQELWYLFLALAVLMLILEMFLIKRIEGKF